MRPAAFTGWTLRLGLRSPGDGFPTVPFIHCFPDRSRTTDPRTLRSPAILLITPDFLHMYAWHADPGVFALLSSVKGRTLRIPPDDPCPALPASPNLIPPHSPRALFAISSLIVYFVDDRDALAVSSRHWYIERFSSRRSFGMSRAFSQSQPSQYSLGFKLPRILADSITLLDATKTQRRGRGQDRQLSGKRSGILFLFKTCNLTI
ncbi:hypothetical protein HGRIS_014452 [Hohenbuehelia grisea]|uniref:Uncharacterized protein n=1 Tax=Hohenbuehelia grisea TaxID=104357 RepID=A0ABR3JUG7_9AGAR